MRHLKSGRKFGRKRSQRRDLLRSLALSLIRHGKIETSEAKAKELRPFIEKLVTRAKSDSVFAKRLVRARLGQEAPKLFSEVAPKYKERSGGYTRITKLGNREVDGSPRAQIEFI